ncbi:MAG TPA: RDD family protein [Epsilonproteobacteria bacterium]|nr:RDD family protein [Campylobacterota bacterium]HHD78973.1 RDD family protein [Campylobacterota bacterium]HHE05936.1 RDD family protein [Campylobacterota bacterium]
MAESTFLPLASMKKRISSFVIDDIVVALLLLAIFYNQLMAIASHLPSVITPESIEVFKNEMNQFSVNNLLLIIALKVLYHTFFVWQNGMTLGKYFMKIKVIELEANAKPTLFKAFFRAVVRVGSEVLFYLGFLMAFFSPLNQTLHDKLSGCVVVDV